MIKLTLTKNEWDEICLNHVALKELFGQLIAHWDLMRLVEIFLDDKLAQEFLTINYSGLSPALTIKLDKLHTDLSCVYGAVV